MDKMNGPKEGTVMAGMCKVYSGLGMLLGTGRISEAMHDKILSLINEEEAQKPKDNDSEKPPVDYPRQHKDPLSLLASPKHDMANAQLEDQKPSGRNSCAGSLRSVSNETQDTWHSAIPDTPVSSQDGSTLEPPVSKIVCPWYSTAGYHCREEHQGKCAWLHENSPGAVVEPLICSFWAENTCVKTPENCRFAHYWAQHRQIAPTPGTRGAARRLHHRAA